VINGSWNLILLSEIKLVNVELQMKG
jgi:hypothetical protein